MSTRQATTAGGDYPPQEWEDTAHQATLVHIQASDGVLALDLAHAEVPPGGMVMWLFHGDALAPFSVRLPGDFPIGRESPPLPPQGEVVADAHSHGLTLSSQTAQLVSLRVSADAVIGSRYPCTIYPPKPGPLDRLAMAIVIRPPKKGPQVPGGSG